MYICALQICCPDTRIRVVMLKFVYEELWRAGPVPSLQRVPHLVDVDLKILQRRRRLQSFCHQVISEDNAVTGCDRLNAVHNVCVPDARFSNVFIKSLQASHHAMQVDIHSE